MLKEIEKGSGKNHGEKGEESPLSPTKSLLGDLRPLVENIKGGASPNVRTRKQAAEDAGLSPDQAKDVVRVSPLADCAWGR